MSPLVHFLLFAVLALLGGFMCRISAPMVREHAGYGYRLVAVVICLAGLGLFTVSVVFLAKAIAGIPE